MDYNTIIESNNESNRESKKEKNTEKIILKERFPYEEISFRASGWMFLFYLGVIKYIREKFVLENIKIIGSSSGAVSACILLIKDEININDNIINEIIDVFVTQKNIFDISNKGCILIDMFINEKYICKKLFDQNELNVACMNVDSKNIKCNTIIFNKFEDINDVNNYLKGAVTIPVIASVKGCDYKNLKLFDSLIYSPHPHINIDKCLKISYTKNCSCGCCKSANSIYPIIDIPLLWCLNPPKDVLTHLYHHGYQRAKDFFENKENNHADKLKDAIIEYNKQYNYNYNIFLSVLGIGSLLLFRYGSRLYIK